MAKTDLETCLQNALENVENDRALALTLLTLQRSNEQLVKLSSLLYKKSSTTEGLTATDKEDLYALIQNEEG